MALNNPILITDSSGEKRRIQIVTLIGSNGEIISLTDNAIDVNPINFGESVYDTDIDFNNSDFTDWVGNPELLFGSAYTASLVNSTSDNPKQIILVFKRPLYFAQIGLFEKNGGTFSNLKITTNGGTVILDDVNKNEKYTFKNEIIGDVLCNSLTIEFYTADTISLSAISIQKAQTRIIRNNIRSAIPISSDSVYLVDLDQEKCSSAGWTGGNIADLISYAGKVLVNDSADNPKSLYIDLIRPIQTNILGLATSSGNFSNVKISISFGEVPGSTVIYDGSTDNTKRQILIPNIPPTTFSSILFEFFTTDTVSVNSVGISKSIQTISRIQGQTPSGNVVDFQASPTGNFKVKLEEYQGDAFGRLRVSEPYTIFDNSLTNSISDTLFWSTLTNGTASGAYDRTTSKYTLTVPANSGDYIVRQTKQRFKYQPGKSHMILITGLLNTETDTIKRVGLIDHDNVNLATITNVPQNGIYFENNNGTFTWNIVNNGSVTESITQANWNIDVCDGTGASLFILDIASTNIFFIDLEWLGVGAVRCGFVSSTGEIVVCHQFQHASNSFTDVYMRTANLPLSYSLYSSGGAGTLKQICSSVISEGGFNPQGVVRSVSNNSDIAIAGGNIEILIGLRFGAENFEYTMIPEIASIINIGNNSGKLMLAINPTYNDVVSWNNISNSTLQYGVNNGGTVSANGIVVYEDFVSSTATTKGTVAARIETALKIGKNLDDSLDELWLMFEAYGATTVRGGITFRELI